MNLRSIYDRAVTSTIANSIVHTFGYKVMSMVVMLGVSIITARLLGPEGRGIYLLAINLGNFFIQFGNLGLHVSNTFTVSKNKELLPQVFSNTLVVGLGFGGFLSLLLWVFYKTFPSIIPVGGWILYFCLLWIPVGLTHLLNLNIFIGVGQISTHNRIEIVNRIILLLAFGILYYFNADSPSLAFLVNVVILSGVLIWGGKKLFLLAHNIWAPSKELFKENFFYALQNYLIALFIFFILKIDLFMIGNMMGNERAGVYSLSQTVGDFVFLLPSIINVILFPKLVEEKEHRIRRTLIYCAVSFFTIMIMFLPAVLLLKPVIGLLFGLDFIGAYQAGLVLILGAGFLSINVILNSYILAHGKSWACVWVWIIGAGTNLGLNLKLIPEYGILGASYATLVVYVAIFVLLSFLSARKYVQKTV